MNNLNSLQSTIQDLKEIVSRNQGANHESSLIVRQIEQIVADIERKTRKQGAAPLIATTTAQAIPVV